MRFFRYSLAVTKGLKGCFTWKMQAPAKYKDISTQSSTCLCHTCTPVFAYALLSNAALISV